MAATRDTLVPLTVLLPLLFCPQSPRCSIVLLPAKGNLFLWFFVEEELNARGLYLAILYLRDLLFLILKRIVR